MSYSHRQKYSNAGFVVKSNAKCFLFKNNRDYEKYFTVLRTSKYCNMILFLILVKLLVVKNFPFYSKLICSAPSYCTV